MGAERTRDTADRPDFIQRLDGSSPFIDVAVVALHVVAFVVRVVNLTMQEPLHFKKVLYSFHLNIVWSTFVSAVNVDKLPSRGILVPLQLGQLEEATPQVHEHSLVNPNGASHLLIFSLLQLRSQTARDQQAHLAGEVQLPFCVLPVHGLVPLEPRVAKGRLQVLFVPRAVHLQHLEEVHEVGGGDALVLEKQRLELGHASVELLEGDDEGVEASVQVGRRDFGGRGLEELRAEPAGVVGGVEAEVLV